MSGEKCWCSHVKSHHADWPGGLFCMNRGCGCRHYSRAGQPAPEPVVGPGRAVQDGLDPERLARALITGTDESGLDPLLEPEQARLYAERIIEAYRAAPPLHDPVGPE